MVDNLLYLEEDMYICPAHRAVPLKRYSRRKDKSGFVRDFRFTNVKIVEAVLFIVNVRNQKVSETDKF